MEKLICPSCNFEYENSSDVESIKKTGICNECYDDEASVDDFEQQKLEVENDND